MTRFIILKEEMDDITKTVESLEELGLLLKVFSETTKNESNEQKCGFLGMLLGTLGASLLGRILATKGVIKGGNRTIRAVVGRNRAGKDF